LLIVVIPFSANKAKSEKRYEEVKKLVDEQNKENKTISIKSLLSAAQEATQKAISILKQAGSEVLLGDLENSLSSQVDSLSILANSLPAPLISGEPKIIITAKSATIAWQTDKEANSLIALAPQNKYNSHKENPYVQTVGKPEANTKNHIVTIYDLEPDTLYHYQVISRTKLGATAKSRDFQFKTANDVLHISHYTIERISSSKAIFRWVTNVDADTKIIYTPYRDNVLFTEEAKTKTNPQNQATTIHEIAINDFEGGVEYQIKLLSSDIKHNTTQKIIDHFSTQKDNLPPEIYQVQTESALSGTGKSVHVQTIISWRTNEAATGQVFYRAGIGPLDETAKFSGSTPLEKSYSKKHVAVITKFKPGQVYQFRIESTDSGGNKNLSKPYTILTPRREESVFQIIMKNLEQLFGWLGKIR